MKIIYAGLLIIFLSITGFIMLGNQQVYMPSRGEQLVNSILAQTAKIIKEKYGISPCGMGAAMPGGPIQGMTLCFDSKSEFDQEQLRELIIKSAQELLKEVNDNDEIQPYLKKRPFTIKNIQIIIYNHDNKGMEIFDPGIAVAQISQGNLSFATVDPQDTFNYKNEYEESYEEALNAINNDAK